MSAGILMEYRGFKSTTQGREYAFHVRLSSEDSRDFTVTISTEAFSSHLVSYQDGPNVCSARLKRELTTSPDVPTGTSFLINQKEMEEHKVREMAGAPKRPLFYLITLRSYINWYIFRPDLQAFILIFPNYGRIIIQKLGKQA